MATATYTILIPTTDELGQPLRVAEAVYEHVTRNLGIEAATIHRGYPFDSLVASTEDYPENDSTFKQLGVYVAEVTNAPVVHVTKAGKNSASWPMKNPHYIPEQGSEPSALTQGPMSVHASMTGDSHSSTESDT